MWCPRHLASIGTPLNSGATSRIRFEHVQWHGDGVAHVNVHRDGGLGGILGRERGLFCYYAIRVGRGCSELPDGFRPANAAADGEDLRCVT